MTDALVPLEPAADGWRLTVSPDLANPMGVLYGGAPLAASIELAEAELGAPTRWAATRFLHGAAIGDELTVSLRVDVAGRRTSHVTVTGASPDGVVFETMMGVGPGRPDGLSQQWMKMPDAGDPESLPDPPNRGPVDGTAIARIQRRLGFGVSPFDGEVQPDGRIGIWMRIPDRPAGDRAALAWLADCMPLGVAAATGRMPAGVSLDNTIRFGREAETDWVLLDIKADAVDHGYAYGTVDCWAQDGTLLGTGSQTAIIRHLIDLPNQE